MDSDDEEEDEAKHNFTKDSEGDIISSFLTEFQYFELSLEADRTDFLRMFSSEDEQADLRTMVDELEQKAIDSAAPTRLTRLLFYLNSIPEDGPLSSAMWKQINTVINDFICMPLTLNRNSAGSDPVVDESQGFALAKEAIREEVEKLGKKIKEANALDKELSKKEEELHNIREIYMEAKVTAKNELYQKSLQVSKAEAEIEERSKKWQAEKANLQRQIHHAAAAKKNSEDARKFKQQVRPWHIKYSAAMLFLGVQELFAATLLPLSLTTALIIYPMSR